jgi:hypothetical protein
MWVGGGGKKKKLHGRWGEKKVPKQNLRSGLRKGKSKVNLLITLVNSGTEKKIPSVPIHPGWFTVAGPHDMLSLLIGRMKIMVLKLSVTSFDLG